MKKITYLNYILLSCLFLFFSCQEDDILIEQLGFTNNEGFTNTFAGSYIIPNDNENSIAERFTWRSAGDNVTYDLQVSGSSDFSSFELVGSTQETFMAVSTTKMIELAALAGLDNDPTTSNTDGMPNNTGTLYFRVVTSDGLTSEIAALNLELEEGTATGPCDVIYGLGDALVGIGWSWDSPVIMECVGNVLKGTVSLQEGIFRFFTTDGDWGSGLNYPHYSGNGYTIDANLEDAMDGDNNFRFIGTPGTYDLVIDGNAKTITLTAKVSTTLWVLGDATPDGWSWGAAASVSDDPVNVWSFTLDFQEGTFRFFTEENDWSSGLNYPHYAGEGYTIDDKLEDAMDGDNNFRFIGTPGIYELVINGNEKTITLNPPQTGGSPLWILGDATPDAWSWDNATEAVEDPENVWSATLNFQEGTFRFFTEENDWSSSLNYPHYAGEGYTIDDKLEDAMDGDNNFRFIGTPGTYELVINGNEKTITLNPPQTEGSSLWILGDATPDAWSWDNATEAVEDPENVWSATLDFQAGTFRFFTEENDWSSGLNYPHFIDEGYTIDENFEDAMDGDNNFRFIGTPGNYTVTVNAVDKTIVLN